MNGLMMQLPLLISSLLSTPSATTASSEIVSRRVEGDIHRYDLSRLAARSRRMAQRARAASASQRGDRVATLAWNGYRHLELYYAVSGSGAVLHTLNPRLHPEQIAYIANHAEDQVLFFDLTFLPLVEAIAPRCKTIKALRRDDRPRAHAGRQHDPEPALLRGPGRRRRATTSPGRASTRARPRSLCYTSGTTGNPKGVLYSHRSTVLHTFAIALPDALGCSARDAILPVVPMFHVNAWGLPYAALHDRARSSSSRARASTASRSTSCSRASGVTLSAGVPTVWQGLLDVRRRRTACSSRPCGAPSSAARPARRR